MDPKSRLARVHPFLLHIPSYSISHREQWALCISAHPVIVLFCWNICHEIILSDHHSIPREQKLGCYGHDCIVISRVSSMPRGIFTSIWPTFFLFWKTSFSSVFVCLDYYTVLGTSRPHGLYRFDRLLKCCFKKMNLFVKMSFEDIAASRKSRQMYSQLGYGLLLRGRPPKLDKNKLYKSDNYTQTRETKKRI